jgi:hypothetical protein
MRTSVLVAMTLAATLGATGAYAATVVNKDKVPYKVSITEGTKTMQVDFKADQTKKNLCNKPCEITLGDSKLKIEKKTETAWIQDGKLMLAK